MRTARAIPYATYGFAAQMAEVEVDVELGTVKVRRIVAAHDVGRAINPIQVEGQIHGGIAQGLGLALMEEYLPGRSENLHDYLIPTVGDMPEIEVIIIEDREPLGPYGAKGIGEPALIPTAPAILGAIHHATGAQGHPRAGDAGARAAPPCRGGPPNERGIGAKRRRRRHHHLRCLSGALPHPAGQDRRLRPLWQCRGRADPHRPDGHRLPYRGEAGAHGALPRRRNGRATLLPAGEAFVTGIGAGTTYPDYKPAPFIVSSRHGDVDMVTVVTEGIFSYCGLKLKIDTDRFVGPEQAAVRAGASRSAM